MMCKGVETAPAPVLELAELPAHGDHCTECQATPVASDEWGPCVAHFLANALRTRVDVCLVAECGRVHPVRHSSQLWVDAMDARLLSLLVAPEQVTP